ncbi:hypothetical protein GUITHDRAFT_101099 [Guillardia theta CCMP2712]|uniref:Uncharacterized protein n=1 Tax=Guillardia theta (strain CCMP2712) TaxID=905079 RepID=L1JYG4_GUITC|nr:hypothetical protein GUITHDRAFT_101099 [Guillardia theta CCMP2712]EKX53397.1 hypothetical protein GUITHDRAFT_101099 [Guillardia theta CCMP2712]|eukprot:XP_005840377.1 hypothetical protein GUITHDRAFT_101099 [Guillardia theta CCMP2712]
MWNCLWPKFHSRKAKSGKDDSSIHESGKDKDAALLVLPDSMGGTRFMLPDKIWDPIVTPDTKDNEQVVHSYWTSENCQHDAHLLQIQDTSLTSDGDTETCSKQSSDSSDRSRMVSIRPHVASLHSPACQPEPTISDLEPTTRPIVTCNDESDDRGEGPPVRMEQTAKDMWPGQAWNDPTFVERSIFSLQEDVHHAEKPHNRDLPREKQSEIGWSEPDINFHDLNERELIASLFLAEECVSHVTHKKEYCESKRNDTANIDLVDLDEHSIYDEMSWPIADGRDLSHVQLEDGLTETCELLSDSDIDDLDVHLHKMIDEHLCDSWRARGDGTAYPLSTAVYV